MPLYVQVPYARIGKQGDTLARPKREAKAERYRRPTYADFGQGPSEMATGGWWAAISENRRRHTSEHE